MAAPTSGRPPGYPFDGPWPPPASFPPNYPKPPPAPSAPNPNGWQNGYWNYQHPGGSSASQSARAAAYGWPPQGASASAQAYAHQQWQQQQQQQMQAGMPPKRSKTPPPDYLATKLTDNGLGLSGMEESKRRGSNPPPLDDPSQTPWIWRPATLREGAKLRAGSEPPPSLVQVFEPPTNSELPSMPPYNPLSHVDPEYYKKRYAAASAASEAARDQAYLQRSQSVNNPLRRRRASAEPQYQPETFLTKTELTPTFSSRIVRTPDYYKQYQRRAASAESPGSSQPMSSASAAARASALSRFSTMPEPLPSATRSLSTSYPSHSSGSSTPTYTEEPSSFNALATLSPLIGATPGQKHASLGRHSTLPDISSLSLGTIQENNRETPTPTPSEDDDAYFAPLRFPESINTDELVPHGAPKPGEYRHEVMERERQRQEKDQRDRERERQGRSQERERYRSADVREERQSSYPPSTSRDERQSSYPPPVSRDERQSSYPPAQLLAFQDERQSSYPPPHIPASRDDRQSSYPPLSSRDDSQTRPGIYAPRYSPNTYEFSGISPSREGSFSGTPTRDAPSRNTPSRSQMYRDTPSRTGFSYAPAHTTSGNQLPTPPREPPSVAQLYPRIRKGYWNRRGDHLYHNTIVYAPPDYANPLELDKYPSSGFMDENGGYIPPGTFQEHADSAPIGGRSPARPYQTFIKYID